MENNPADICINNIANDYGPLVSAICHRMIRNEEDSKDAAQEAWTGILKGLPQYRGEAKISTWIYTVTYHTAMRFIQKDKSIASIPWKAWLKL